MEKLIKRRVLVSMIFIGLTLMGYFSYQYLPMELYPDAEYPTLNVSISAKNEMDPTYIRNKAVIPVEGVISSMEDVEEISTRISTKNARINISFSQKNNIKYSYLKLEEKIKSLQSIPDDFTIRVNKSGTNQVSTQFMTLQVLGDDDVDYVRNITDADVVSKLEAIDGISAVTVMGGRQKSIEITLNKTKCDALKITASRISSLISSNMAAKSFAGSVYENNKRYFVNVTAEYLATEDLGSIVIADGPILLKDVADINFGIKEEESYSRVNGKEVITLILSRTPTVNLIDLSDRVKKDVEKLNLDLAFKGVNIKIDNDEAEVMSKNIDTIINLGISGAILAIFILYIFLKNIKIVSFIALAIPISVFSSFYFFYLFGITINSLTLTGIALAVGMLLDNSVVVMENIFRLRSLGMTPIQASVNGTKEVCKAVIAATATTITVFLPFLFSDDFLLQLIGQHVGISIIATLLLSLIVALLLIPMAVNYFMEKNTSRVNFSSLSITSRPVQIYTAILKMSLRRPSTIVLGSIALLIAVIALSMSLTLNTLKEVESDTFQVYMTFYSGNTLNRTDEVVRLFEDRLNDVPEIEQFTTNVYNTDAQLTIKLKEDYKEINDKTLGQLKTDILNLRNGLQISDISLEALASSENFEGGGSTISGATALLERMGMGSQSEKIVLRGQDFEQMTNLAELLKYQLEELENISSANVSVSSGKREAQLRFDQYLMGLNDVSSQNVSSELRSFSPSTTTSTTYKTDDEEYDIIIKTEDDKPKEYDADGNEKEKEEEKRTIKDLRDLQVENSEKALVPLRSFSSINLRRGKGNINRLNQDENLEIKYRFNSDINESKDLLKNARTEVDDLIQSTDIPSGVAVEVVHEEAETAEYIFLILAAFAIIYMILASVFESLTSPIVLMFAIPLAAIGSLIALLITSNSLSNANVLIGFIILIGIVVNNSIILIDYTTQLRRRGNRKPRALLTAGISRLRPILITAITTIIAMFPLAMGQGEYVSGLGAPFAITVIGGLTMSTLLTLVIVPTLYSGMEDALNRLRTQSKEMKIIQIVLFAASLVFIYYTTDSLVWRLAYLAGSIILVPGVTWFIENSLRQANSNIIDKNDEIHIEIRNLVKIYGQLSEFQQEWASGTKIRERLGIRTQYKTIKDLEPLVWLVPLLIFAIYFTYFYQELAFWALFLGVLTWMLALLIISILQKYAYNNNLKIIGKVLNIINVFVQYISPLLTILWVAIIKGSAASAYGLGLLWYLAILTMFLTKKLHKNNINVDALEGRFSDIKRNLYTMAMKMPIIGFKKPPFKALNAVSLNIHTGMFGLLGPNGAGKTTLMRIICGILSQSYGKIFINGIDTAVKREELQGLIGYLPQEFGTYENLTAEQFLDYQAILKGLINIKVRKNRVEEVLQAVHMYENKDKKISGFSGGMKQRIGIAQTLLNLPRILVVDEPTAGLDPRERIRFRNLLVELSKNRIVIFSTHIIEDIASSCNQVGVINKGSLKYHGTPSEMANIAKEVCWTFEIEAKEFAKLSKDLLIVHHIRSGENIKVRCLSEKKPTPDAVLSQPVLEDSYLWLLHGVKIANNEELITSEGLN